MNAQQTALIIGHLGMSGYIRIMAMVGVYIHPPWPSRKLTKSK